MRRDVSKLREWSFNGIAAKESAKFFDVQFKQFLQRDICIPGQDPLEYWLEPPSGFSCVAKMAVDVFSILASTTSTSRSLKDDLGVEDICGISTGRNKPTLGDVLATAHPDGKAVAVIASTSPDVDLYEEELWEIEE